MRKEIDLFIKENLNFKPFKAIRKSSYGGCEFYVVEVKAIRTDRKLIVGLEGSSRNDHVGKSEAVHFMRYDHDLVKELKEIEDEYDNARKVRDMKRVELNKRLVPLDLSKYDLV